MVENLSDKRSHDEAKLQEISSISGPTEIADVMTEKLLLSARITVLAKSSI